MDLTQPRRGGRVLFLTSNYPRWAGDTTTPFVHDLAVDLGARGWQVRVLAPHAPGAARDETIDGVQVHRFRYLVPASAQTVCYGGGALVNIRSSPLTRAKIPALVLAEGLATARSLMGGVDLVHAHWVLPQGFVAATTPFRGVPRVLTAHGGDVFGLRGGVLDRFASLALRLADRVTVNSAATEAAVREISGGRAAISRVPIGVDLGRTARSALVNQLRVTYRRGSGPLLVFVGRVVEEKGVEEIVHAVGALTSCLPNITAAIVGIGQHRQRVRRLAEELGVGDRVATPGWADPVDVPSWFAAADVVVAPSKVGPDGWVEGQGLSIIEAMAAGRPVVSTRTGGIIETIIDGENGLLVPPAEPMALAAAVQRLVANPQLAEQIAARARLSVLDRFDRSVTADRIHEIYLELTARRSRAQQGLWQTHRS
jgi:phosphatidyl-myo-inositol dimannoside synthase